jgi:integrase
MIYARKQLPKYCNHRPSGRAYVRIGGKMYYLGKYGSEASRREYDRIIAEFVANGRQARYCPDEILIENLIAQYVHYINAEIDYSQNSRERINRTLRFLNEFYGKQPASAFSPMALKALRQRMLEQELARDTINQYIGIVKQVFYWGCEEEIIPADIAGALRMVRSLQRGRTSAKEHREVKPVDDAIVEKTLKHLKPQIQDMVKVQRLISGRPQDVMNMRPCDIDRSGEIWKYTPFTHKTKKRGKIRELPIGPKAQQILLRYLDSCKGNQEGFVFTRRNGRQYTSTAYANLVTAACRIAGVPHWSPNQLRDTGGTAVWEKFGLEYAQAVLGHSDAKTTEIYAKASFEKAAKVAREIG